MRTSESPPSESHETILRLEYVERVDGRESGARNGPAAGQAGTSYSLLDATALLVTTEVPESWGFSL